ncbi:MFS transporter, partial [Microbacterium sp.]|uniref:MFS transporter n=1 Tax=Microbacterium sp. TaxID=51671 RepID=UPI0028119E24
VLFGGAVLSLMLPFLFTTGSPEDPPARWWSLAALAVLFVALVVWERRYEARGRVPLLPLGLFSVPSFRNGVLVGSAYFMGMPALFLITTLYLQTGLHFTALNAALVTIGFALASAVTSWLGGRLVARQGRRLVVLGVGTMLVAIVALVLAAVLAPVAHVGWIMAVVMVIGGLGGGFVVSPNQTLMYADVPVAQAGLAGSVGQLGQRMGTAIGMAIALSLFYAAIYRERDTTSELDVFHHAYTYGMVAVAGFIAIALIAALADLARRRRVDA